GLVLAGLAGLLTAVSIAMMYLLQTLQLKSKHPGPAIFKLPSLEALDRVHFAALLWGSVFLSLGMLTGILWARDLQELNQVFTDRKVILSLVTCILYWAILLLRFSSLRRGQKIAIGTVHTFILLFFTVVCSHGFGRFPGGR
ncbi:MAG: cytochrome c biogenesis protein CcsA, partial [Candidatus Omnitrophota bacterium]